MGRLLKIIFSLILIVIVGSAIGAYYFVRHFDLNSYKAMIEQQAYKATGRELKLNGDAHLAISFIPTLVVDDVTFANAAWAQQPYMVKLSSLEVELSVLPLLRKELIIKEFHLVQPQIYLEKAANGMTNWDFSKAEQVSSLRQTLGFAQLDTMAVEKSFAKDINPLPEYIEQISLQNITIEQGFLQYFDAEKKTTQELSLNDFHLNMETLDSPIKTEIDAVYQNEPIKALLILGSFNDLFAEDKPFAVDADIKAYQVNALIKGYLFDVLKDDIAYDLTVVADSPKGNFNLPAVAIDTTAKGNLAAVAMKINSLTYAGNQLSGDLDVDISKKIPQIKAVLQSPSIDLRTLQNKKTAVNFELIKTAQASDLIPNTPIPYDLLLMANGSANLYVKKLIIDNAITANNVRLKATLNNGLLDVKPLNLDFGSGNIDLNTVVNANKKTISLNLKSKDVLIQDVHKEFIIDGAGDFGVLSGGKTFLTANLSSHGSTLRQLIQNATGQTVVIVSESKIQTGHLHFLTEGIIPQILGVLKVDTKKSNKVNMQCAVVRADIAGGKVNVPGGIAIQSDGMTLSSSGKINLLNDKIDFNLVPSFNFDTGITQALSSLVRITGTMDNPKIALDDKQALKTVVGIATTGGLSYLGSQAVLSDNSPCYTALKGTSYQSMVPQPSEASKAQQKTIEDTKAAFSETKAAVKNELKNIKQNAKDIFNFIKGKK